MKHGKDTKHEKMKYIYCDDKLSIKDLEKKMVSSTQMRVEVGPDGLMLPRSSRAVSGYSGVYKDNRKNAASKPWSANVRGFRSAGYEFPRDAAIALASFKRKSTSNGTAQNSVLYATRLHSSCNVMSASTCGRARGIGHQKLLEIPKPKSRPKPKPKPKPKQKKKKAIPISPPQPSAPPPQPSAPLHIQHRWWEKNSVHLPKDKIDGMDLFGIRVMFEYSSLYRDSPVYDAQKRSELTRLTSKDTTSMSNTEVSSALRAKLVSLLHGKVLSYISISLRDRLARQGCRSESDFLGKMTLKDLYATMAKVEPIFYRLGTVIGYLPAVSEHVIEFDDAAKLNQLDISTDKAHPHEASSHVIRTNLCRSSGWTRIPWDGNIFDSTDLLSERPDTNTSDVLLPDFPLFGPPCPKCFEHLGVGAQAWTKCVRCGLMEPGAMWSMRFAKHDPHAWNSVHYEENDDD